MRHAGVHRLAGIGFPNGPANDALYMQMPGPLLMLDSEARWHIDRYRAAGRPVVWRSMAIPPAKLGWSVSRYVDAVLVHTGEQQTSLDGGLIFANEWNLSGERGDHEDDWQDVERRYTFLNAQIIAVAQMLRSRVRCELWYPAWSPHQFWRENVERWAPSVDAVDVLAFHEYETLEAIQDTYRWLRERWPDKPLACTEWNCREGGEPEIRRVLEWFARVEQDDPNFVDAYYFVGKWYPPADSWTPDLDVEGRPELVSLFLSPPTVQPAPIPEPEPVMTEIEAFIRDAAQKRGIDPDTAVKVARSEGGVDEPAEHGDFETGDSWWPFQLHYGGAGYEQYGTVAGMGNDFTRLTGWQPGDPKAWRDSVRYALNRAKAGGWGPWYGAAAVGVTGFDGIDRNTPWDANSEHWDFETGGGSMPKVTFNPDYPASKQDDDWSCAPTSLDWAMRSLGRAPGDQWIETDMVALGYVSRAQGLLDHTGAGIVRWLSLPDAEHYGADGYGISNNQCPITWDALIPEIDPHPPYPLLLGLPDWGGPNLGHWVGVRGYDASRGAILLANPASSATYGQDSLTRAQFDAKAGGNASIVRVLHPDLIEAQPTPVPPAPITKAEIDALIATLTQWRDRVPA